MIEAVFGILTAILCVMGVVGIIRWAALKIANSGADGKRVYAILLDGKDADIRLQMMIETLEWDNVLKDARAYAIDGGMSFEMAEYCRLIAEKHRIEFVPLGEAPSVLELFK